MKSEKQTGLWTAGRHQLRKTLNDAEARELAPLLRLLDENHAEKLKLKNQIDDVKARYRKKRKEIGGFLFIQ